jgi:hypothetical protein
MGLPGGRPSAFACDAASCAAAEPWLAAVPVLVDSFFRLDWLTHGACKPTYSGSRLQPCPTTDVTHGAVRFGCVHARFAPPM